MAYQTVKSVKKALSILELLVEQSLDNKYLTLADISQSTGILPVTAHNLLRTLEDRITSYNVCYTKLLRIEAIRIKYIPAFIIVDCEILFIFIKFIIIKKPIFKSEDAEKRKTKEKWMGYCFPYNNIKNTTEIIFIKNQTGKYLNNILFIFSITGFVLSLFLTIAGQNVFINKIPKLEIIV